MTQAGSVERRLQQARPPRRWSVGPRRALLAATLWVSLYVAPFVGFLVWFVTSPDRGGDTPGWLSALFVVHLLTVVLSAVLMGLYAWVVFQNERLGDERRVVWTVALVAAAPFAMPAYWFRHVRSAPHSGRRPPGTD